MNKAVSLDLHATRLKRSYATRVAARLSLLGKTYGTPTDSLQWNTLSLVPEWCLEKEEAIKTLQVTCGALYLAPQIKSTIDGTALRKLQSFLGHKLFNYIRNSYQCEVHPDTSTIGNYPEDRVLKAGASVLLDTLPEKGLADLYKNITGPELPESDSTHASHIYTVSMDLLSSDPSVFPESRRVSV